MTLPVLLVRVFQKKRTNSVGVGRGVRRHAHSVYREREVSFKELPYTVVGAGESEICRVGWQAVNLGRSWCSCSPKAV